jgi:VWFA-related protein
MTRLRQPPALALLIQGSILALAMSLAMPAQVVPQGAQQQAPAQEQRPNSRAAIRSTVELVVVPVTVKDARGNLVDDIRQDEFTIFEDDVEQRISTFSTDAFPLSALVVLDNDLKPKAAEQVRRSLISLAGAFSESDEVALGRFASFFTLLMDFTTDNDRLMAQLKDRAAGDDSVPDPASTAPNPAAGDQPIPGAPTTQQQASADKSTKHLDDALHGAAEVLRARPHERRKVIILVSDGVDAKNNTYSYDQTLIALLSSDASVYAIGTDAALLRRGASPLSRYAHATGGDTYFVNNEAALSQAYAHVAEEARHQYTLAYSPTGTDRTKNYHSVEVRVKRAGLNVLARDGYYLVHLP